MPCTNPGTCHQISPSEPLTDLHWSRLKSLLRENQPPSDIEKQTLAKVEHDIEEYDLAIARLQSAVVSFECQRDAAKNYVSRHKSLMAPIRRLSNDVLVEIFTYLCSDTVLDTWGNRISLPQLHLCQVCKYWHSLVNDSPLLWSTQEMTVTLSCENERSISDTTLLNLANLVLTRSGNCPLTITLDGYIYRDVHPVSALLLQHADRWLSASVAGCSQRFCSVSSFPQLKHLELDYGLGAIQNIQTIPAMSSLESLIISQLPVHRPFSLPDFPWKQLKRLTLDASLVSQCASVVSWCVQLEHIALTFRVGSCDSESLPSVSIVSQTVTSATLKWAKRCEKLFFLLQFPRLHTLDLYGCGLYADSFIAHLPSITNLNLKELSFDHHLLALLRLFPTVTHLSFRNSWKFRVQIETLLDFFSNLHPTDPSQSRTLLPRLAYFDMQVWGANAQIDHSPATSIFVEMVKSRVMENRLEQRLKTVRFSVPNCCLNHEFISSLAYLLKVGIAISIQDSCGFIL